MEESKRLRHHGRVNQEAACNALPGTLPSSQARSRLATSLLFLVDGIGFGTWAALIPSIKQRFELGESGLSMVLLSMVVGALLSMSLVGRALARRGSKAMLGWLAPGYGIALALLVLAPGFGWLLAAGALFGAFKGAFDVSLNSQAITIENAMGRPVMSTFQGLWSLGGLIAALLVGLALRQGLSAIVIGFAIAAALVMAALAACGSLATGDVSTAPRKRGLSLPNGRLVKIGALAALALFSEGVMLDWSAVYARSVAGAEAWLAPLAFGVFSLSMASGRFLGDWIAARHGGPSVLRFSGVLSFIGMLLIIFVKIWPVTFLGLGFMGLGVANLVPVLFGAAGRAHEESVAQGVATVSVIGYFGFLAGPPAIGGLSHWLGLPGAFSVVLVFALLLAIPGPKVLRSVS